MRNIPQQILDKAKSNDPKLTYLAMDVWPDKGDFDVLTTARDWEGVGQPYVGSDSNVSAATVPGSMVLANGAAHAVSGSYSSPLTVNSSLSITARVIAHWHQEGNNIFGHKLVHDYFEKIIDKQVSTTLVPFTNKATHLVDTIKIRAYYRGNLSARKVYVRIVDGGGNQKGRRKSFTPPYNSAATFSISGFHALLSRGVKYFLEFSFAEISADKLPDPYFQQPVTYRYIAYIMDAAIPASERSWSANTRGARGFPMGGNDGFQASGSFERVLDVNGTPTDDGIIEISDVVPGIGGADPTSMTIGAYYSDTAKTGPWTFFGNVTDGESLPPHRYWKVSVSMASNGLNDETPELQDVRIKYQGDPVTIASEADIRNGVRYAYSGLDSISSLSSQLSRDAASAVRSEMRVYIEDTPHFRNLLLADRLRLKGAPARIRVGYIDVHSVTADPDTVLYPTSFVPPWVPTVTKGQAFNVPMTFELISGSIHDVKYSGGKFIVELRDAMELSDIKFPAATSGPFSSKTYTLGTHLADVAGDIWLNQINIRSIHIDENSLADMKALYPSRTLTADRTISKPIKAAEALGEIAKLLQAQWVQIGGRIALMPETSLADEPLDEITPDDIVGAPLWSIGWDSLKNAVVTFSGYSGSGSSNDADLFTTGRGIVDSTSAAALDDQVFMEAIYDKWGLSTTQIDEINAAFVNANKQGSQIVLFNASLRLIGMEPADRTTFRSQQIPTGVIEGEIVGSNLDWQNQQMLMTVREVF